MGTRRRPSLGRADERARLFLVASVVVTVVLFLVPYGRLVAYPLVLISTLAHELGHGLSAVLVGGDFERLEMWPNGSGAAFWSAAVGRFGRAFIAAGGLVGPAILASLCFLGGMTVRRAKGSLGALVVLLLGAEVLVVRNAFAFFFVGVLIAILVLLVLYAADWLLQTSILFLGVQMALSVFSRGDYLFTPVAETGRGPMPSDVAHIADALLLPYWFWGALCGLVSVAVLVMGLGFFFRRA